MDNVFIILPYNGAVNNIMMNMYSDISLYMKLVIISIAVLMLYALFKDK